MQLHAFVKIIVYIVALILINYLPVKLFWIFFTLCVSSAFLLDRRQFVKKCIRLRWLFLSVWLIYALMTSGEYMPIFNHYGLFTFEGAWMGLVQISKIMIAIACLSILFYQSTIQQLISGLYRLLYPFSWLGFNIEQFSVRLLLTLKYVDEMTQLNFRKTDFLKTFELSKIDVNAIQLEEISLDSPSLNASDSLILIIISVGLISWIGLS